MRLTRRLHHEERGQALTTALLTVVVLLALGLALLSIVDVQAKQSGTERTRDRGFNLAESVLTNEAFVLAKNWPAAAVTSGAGTVAQPVEATCGTVSTGTTLGTSAAAGTGAAVIQANLANEFTDGAYAGARWRLQICDDDGTSTVWNEARLTQAKNWDKNANNLVWVRAESTVAGKTRAVAGLVKVRSGTALDPRFGLVAGNVNEDLSTTLSNVNALSALGGQLVLGNPPVAEAAAPNAYPNSGITGIRCGVLDSTVLTDPLKTCVSGAIGALNNGVPVVQPLVGTRVVQYPTATSTDAETIGQLRAQAKASGTYLDTSAGGSPATTTTPCTIPAAATASTVVFLEKVGGGDDYCVIDVSTASRRYKALVIGSGRVIVRGDNTIAAYSDTAPKNLFTGPIYALNSQTTDKTSRTPAKELVRIEKGARVRGAVHADGANSVVSTIPPDFNTDTLARAIACQPSVLALVSCNVIAPLLTALGVSALVDKLINGDPCFIKVGVLVLGVTVQTCVALPATPAATVVAGITSQLAPYGSPIRSDPAIVGALTVYGTSGVIPGTFMDLQPAR